MKYLLVILCLCAHITSHSQTAVDTKHYNPKGGTYLSAKDNTINIKWPAGNNMTAQLLLSLRQGEPLFKSVLLQNKTIAEGLDPAFILTVGKRDLVSQNGWNIFFDKVPNKPHQSYVVNFNKDSASIRSEGEHTIIRIATLHADSFTGALEITLYNGSPLLNIAAVMSTNVDSTAIVYDAGLVTKESAWNKISWSNTNNELQSATPSETDSSTNLAVKYRTIIGENKNGSLAVFPAPHQYFYPLDEAFNLHFTWYGNNYRQLLQGFGLGIRQELEGDKRFVPWFNAPPGTQQRLNFFCLLSNAESAATLESVKKFTHNDTYVPLAGYKTMCSHFHNEFIMNVVMKGKPIPEHPSFVDVFKKTGVNIVHLAEFHYTAHPKGPDEKRLTELKALFDQCKRLSDDNFLLLPGEEPNEFFGGHWLAFFPKPVYWIMSRKDSLPFVTNDAKYGTVYRVADTSEMLELLQKENGLAWTAHPRTKGSTGYPDAYKNSNFFHSDRFFGAAWKAMPADLSQPRLGKRVFDLMDDMNNWGLHKHVIGEADLFSIEPENEMYAHLNVNYLQLQNLPNYSNGWQPVLDVIQQGKFFTTTGEVLLPSFTVNGKSVGETAILNSNKAVIKLNIDWTFPLHFAEIISGDGKEVYREKIDLDSTHAFGKQAFTFTADLKDKKWVRLEVWDVAANGAFTQTIWLQ